MLKTKDIEGQLFDAKLQQASLQFTEEKEKYLQEKQKVGKEECSDGEIKRVDFGEVEF